MAIIDPEGLFGGDRLRKCSNTAQLHWPRLYLASNGFGRLEISYARIIGRAYATFHPLPTEEELNSIVSEYVENHLLFLYQYDGQIWGQWDTQPDKLPRHKTANDRRSPVPPEAAFRQWQASYRNGKSPSFLSTKVASGCHDLPGSCHTSTVVGASLLPLPQAVETNGFPKLCGNISETSPYDHRRGVGIGIEVVSRFSEVSRATSIGQLALPEIETSANGELLTPEAKKPLAALQEAWFDERFWPHYWRKVHRSEALASWRRRIKTEAEASSMAASMIAQKPHYEAREMQHRPLASTWINRHRDEDGAELFDVGTVARKPDAREERRKRAVELARENMRMEGLGQ